MTKNKEEHKCFICLKPARNKISILIENNNEEEIKYICDFHLAEKKAMERKAKHYVGEQF